MGTVLFEAHLQLTDAFVHFVEHVQQLPLRYDGRALALRHSGGGVLVLPALVSAVRVYTDTVASINRYNSYLQNTGRVAVT